MALDSSLDPLIRLRSPRESKCDSSESSSRASHRGIMTNRFIAVLTLVVLVATSLYFQSEIRELSLEIALDESKISKLQEVVAGQEEVIQRFNNAVTNSDVLGRLKSLENALNATVSELKGDLMIAEKEISIELQNTVNLLDQTVTKAQAEIEDEVNKVKIDVEQYVRTTQDQFSMENSFMVYQLAGTFTLLSGLISMWHMTAHLRKFNQPVIQRKILAILWMCPIYAITSWFSLVFHEAEGYLAIVKDFYEAYIIYQFLSFCISVLGRGDRSAVVDLLAANAGHLSPPFRLDCMCNRNPYDSDRDMASAVLLQCQIFALQFVFMRPTLTIAMFVLDKYGYYGPTGNPMDYRSPQFYIVAAQNASVFIAFTGLMKFYHAVDKQLAWCRPFAKFLCIKGVVFMTFWQGLAISLLANTTDVGGKNAAEWAKSAQNFLICLEMLLFSIAHFYTFPTNEWEEGYRASHEGNGKFGDSIALGDFMNDLKLILRSKSTMPKIPKQPTVPEGNEDEREPGGNGDDEATQAMTMMADSECDEAGYDGYSFDVHAVEDRIAISLSVDDPEIEEATARLLASKILDNEDWDALVEADENLRGTSALTCRQPLHKGEEEDGANDSMVGQYMGSVLPQAPPPAIPGDGTPPSERTGLLSGASRGTSESDSLNSFDNNVTLRPSIFTTVAEIGMKSPVNLK